MKAEQRSVTHRQSKEIQTLKSDYLSSGKFKSALSYIEANGLKIEGPDGIQVISHCCKAAKSDGVKSKGTIEWDYLVRVVRKCEFNDLNGTELENYLQCSYHVTKLLIEANEFNLVMSLRAVLIPAFVQNVVTDQQKNYYKNNCHQLHNYLIKLFSKVEPNVEIVSAIELLTEMYTYVMKDMGKNVTTYAQWLSYKSYPSVSIEHYCDCVLGLMERERLILSDADIFTIVQRLCKTTNAENYKSFLIRFKRFINFCRDDDHILNDLVRGLAKGTFNGKRLHENEQICAFVINVLYQLVQSVAKFNIESFAKINEFALKVTHPSNLTCCTKCNLKTNLSVPVKAALLPVLLIKTCAQAEQYLNELMSNFKRATKLIKVAHAANCELVDWMNINTVSYMYKIGMLLFKESSASTAAFLHFYIKRVLELDVVKLKNVEYLKNAFNMYSEYLYKNKNSKLGLVYSSFLISLQLEPNPSFNLFLVCKQTDEALQDFTCVEILNQNIADVQKVYPSFNGIKDKKFAETLLLQEFNALVSFWMNRRSVSSVLKHLTDLNVEAAIRVITALTNEYIVGLDSKAYESIRKCLQVKNCCAIDRAKLLFFAYKWEKAVAIKKSYEEITIVEAIRKSKSSESKRDDEMEKEDDRLDIFSCYKNLRLSNVLDMFPYLSEAIELYARAGEATSDIFNILVMIGYEYRMNSLKPKLDPFVLALDIAKRLNDHQKVLYMSGLLDESIEQSLSDKLTDSLDDNISCCSYYSSLASFRVERGDFEGAIENYVLASKYYFKIQPEQGDLLADMVLIQFLFLEAKLGNVPCGFKVPNHDCTSSKPYIVYSTAIKKIKNGISKAGVRVLLLLFEVTEFILKSNGWMRLPREMRCYSRDVIVLAQKLLLPLRVANLLVALAKADLMTCQWDDCKTKLDGVSYILNHDPTDEITNGIETIALEPTVSGSPGLRVPQFQAPTYLTHVKECGCLPCENLYYQTIVLRKIHLVATLHDARNEEKLSSLHYEGCVEMYKEIEQQIEPKTELLLDYAKYLICRDLKPEALRILKQILTIFETHNNYINFYLHNEVNILILILSEESNDDYIIKAPRKVPVMVSLPKTPEHKVSTVKFELTKSPEGTPLPPIRKRTVTPLLMPEKSPEFTMPKTPRFKIYSSSVKKQTRSGSSAKKNSNTDVPKVIVTDSESKETERKALVENSKIIKTRTRAKTAASKAINEIKDNENVETTESLPRTRRKK